MPAQRCTAAQELGTAVESSAESLPPLSSVPRKTSLFQPPPGLNATPLKVAASLVVAQLERLTHREPAPETNRWEQVEQQDY